MFTHFIYRWYISFYKSRYWPEFYLSLVYFILQKPLLARVLFIFGIFYSIKAVIGPCLPILFIFAIFYFIKAVIGPSFIYLWHIVFNKSGYWPVIIHFIYRWYILFYKEVIGRVYTFYLSLVSF